ncbi:phasin family protein [Actinospongicola halichondriae]|uniref:phasin family protein n=1 Tax=Actinospongicola halichondriae TaxID=3236844 RepID=UPI003D3D2D6F
MAQNPLIKRYLDAGMAFTQMTQTCAEAIVKDLVKAGEVQTQRAEELVNQLVERSRTNTDKFLEVVRKEVRDQIAGLGLATKDDIARLEQKLAAAPKKAGTKKAAARKPAKKAVAEKAAARKPAKKAGAKKTSAAKRAAKKSAS